MSKEENIAKRILGADRVRSVRVVRAVNEDGERVRRVYVVYESSRGPLTVRDMEEVTSEIWSIGAEDGDESFPIASYVSSDDERTLSPAQ